MSCQNQVPRRQREVKGTSDVPKPDEGTEGPQSEWRICSKREDSQKLSKFTHCKEGSMPFLGKCPTKRS